MKRIPFEETTETINNNLIYTDQLPLQYDEIEKLHDFFDEIWLFSKKLGANSKEIKGLGLSGAFDT